MTDKYENMRLLFLDFIADPMCEEDEAAWKRHLNTYDELLAEIKQLRKAIADIADRMEATDGLYHSRDFPFFIKDLRELIE